MSTINFAKAVGTGFTSDFSNAVAFSPRIGFTANATDLNLSSELQNPYVDITGGVFLSNELNSNFDSTVYATASQSVKPHAPSLGDTITITFPFPIASFSVTIFNGYHSPASFGVFDNLGDSSGTQGFNIAADGSPNDSKTVVLPISGPANSVSIEALDPTLWNFSIDNISFNYPTGAVSKQTAQNPGGAILIPLANASAATINALYPNLLPSSQDVAIGLATANLYINEELHNILYDPFDPNYQQTFTPTFVQLPAIQPDSTITQQTANDANTALSDLSNAAAYVQAVAVTLNRLDSATQVGDQASVALQSADLSTFLALASSSLAAAGYDLDTLAFDLSGVTLPTVTTQEINSFLSNIKTNGFAGLSQQEQALLNQFGLSSTDQQNIVNEMLSANPANAPTSLVGALVQVETGVLGLAHVFDATAPEADATLPAVAVEGSMYNAVGSADEITLIATEFLPGQIANAIKYGYNPQVYACETVGLAFAFGNENGGQAFANNFGPSNKAMPATHAGDMAFAAAAASAIFGSAANAGTPTAILNFVSNWEAFYTAHGIPGIANATASQIVQAARGAAWGDAVGVALAGSLGPLPPDVANFLADAVQGTAIYSASLTSQPQAAAAQAEAPASLASAANEVQLTGVAATSDHAMMWHR
jgi:hypothetical protein